MVTHPTLVWPSWKTDGLSESRNLGHCSNSLTKDVFVLCGCVTHYHTLNSLEQHTFIISVSVGLCVHCSAVCLGLQVSCSCNQFVGWGCGLSGRLPGSPVVVSRSGFIQDCCMRALGFHWLLGSLGSLPQSLSIGQLRTQQLASSNMSQQESKKGQER